ncbi:hypothetical protein GXW78_07460 [Roseomonas terrae]|uniref:Uncharacterized protein n=1 Tax=Neoroseomonas terrae TaxID=424799 RepID=A0ABS5EEP6_9PROT|nr:hypothetical protein [Neoroseomonas terrae]MBR0649491.1 hypothetical protein [Neoroseomonas terrae]
MKLPPEDPALEALARRKAEALARAEFGEGGFCRQVMRQGDTHEFWCHIAHQPGEAGDLVGKMVTVKVP